MQQQNHVKSNSLLAHVEAPPACATTASLGLQKSLITHLAQHISNRFPAYARAVALQIGEAVSECKRMGEWNQ